MKLKEYLTSATFPEVYTPGTATMWDDPHISRKLLDIHLSPDTDLASRKPSTIISTVEWILSQLPGKELHILDLGCGPGLYTEQLAARGHMLTGMDISANSIAYAQKSANKNNFQISYLQGDYLKLDVTGKYDLILMIFTDFGVLSPAARDTLLGNVYKALKPGGIFLFDTLNLNYPLSETGNYSWETSGDNGFWKDSPYLLLQANHFYNEQNVSLSQHTVIDEEGYVEIYRFWTHAFSNEDIRGILKDKGFTRIQNFDKILPDSSMYRSDQVTFHTAVK